MHAIVGIFCVVGLALAVSSVPVAEQQKWYELEDAELQALAKQLRPLRHAENFKHGLVSITFGKSSAFITNDDGTYLFDAYRMVGPNDITHVLLSPATGNPKSPPPPFQSPPSAIISKQELPEPSHMIRDAANVFPKNTMHYKGSPVFVLEALGKVPLKITDVKKLMNRRELA